MIVTASSHLNLISKFKWWSGKTPCVHFFYDQLIETRWEFLYSCYFGSLPPFRSISIPSFPLFLFFMCAVSENLSERSNGRHNDASPSLLSQIKLKKWTQLPSFQLRWSYHLRIYLIMNSAYAELRIELKWRETWLLFDLFSVFLVAAGCYG